MAAVWFRAISELRRRWRGSVVLAVLAGIGGGIAIATFEGARRTDTTLDRFLAAMGEPANATVEAEPGALGDISGLPHVARTASITIASLRPPALASRTPGSPDSIQSIVFDDPSRPFLRGAIVVDGRVPNVRAAGDVAIDESAAHRRGWRVGDRLTFTIPPPETFGQEGGGSASDEPTVELTVTAIVRLPQDLEPAGAGVEQATFRPADDLWLTPAFLDRHPGATLFTITAVWLAGGERDLKAFTKAVDAASGGAASVGPGTDTDTADVVADSTRAIDLQANALRIAAALTAVAVLFAAALALSRQIRAGAEEWPTLRVFGMTRGQQVGVGFASSTAVALGAAVIAVVTAIGLSSRFPYGFPRQAEVDPGFRVDVPVLAGGALAIAVILAAWSAFAARRLAGSTFARSAERFSRRPSTSRVGRAIGRAGAPPTAVVGVGMALDAHGSGGAVPVRVSVTTMTAVIAAIVGAFVFATSLDHLVATPALQGWRWDVLVTGDPAKLGAQLADDRAATAVTGGAFATIQIAGRDVAALALEPVIGGGFEQIVAGRAPTGAGDIALGAKTMRALGVAIGDRIAISGGESRTQMVVVGRAVMPSALGFPGMALADGAVITGAGLRAFELEPDITFAAARFTPGTDIAAHTATFESSRVIAKSPRSADVENLRRVAGIPRILAARRGLVAVITLFHLLVTTIHRRRRELALLRALGFRPRQVVATLGWQASTVTAASVVAGIPLGIAAGRWAWSRVAGSLGVPAVGVVPTLPLLAVGIGALALANIVTWLSAWSAGRIAPATALRSD